MDASPRDLFLMTLTSTVQAELVEAVFDAAPEYFTPSSILIQ